MSLTLRLFLIVLIIINIILIIWQLRKRKMSNSHASLWIVMLLVLIVLAIFPNIVIKLSEMIGFEAASNMIFLIGFFCIFYLCFILTLNISRQNKKIKTLTQELSILKKKVTGYEERK